MRTTRRLFIPLCLLFVVPLLPARVTHVETATRTDVLTGQSFGDAGPYERITGKIYFSVSIANLHNQRIVDLSNAVNLQNGEVELTGWNLRDPSVGAERNASASKAPSSHFQKPSPRGKPRATRANP
jgi:hypothetical protein